VKRFSGGALDSVRFNIINLLLIYAYVYMVNFCLINFVLIKKPVMLTFSLIYIIVLSFILALALIESHFMVGQYQAQSWIKS
jgi:hypothetical protein